MITRNDYTNQMAATLEKWSTQLGELQAKVRDAGAEQKAQVETAVAALKVQRTAYQERCVMRATRHSRTYVGAPSAWPRSSPRPTRRHSASSRPDLTPAGAADPG